MSETDTLGQTQDRNAYATVVQQYEQGEDIFADTRFINSLDYHGNRPIRNTEASWSAFNSFPTKDGFWARESSRSQKHVMRRPDGNVTARERWIHVIKDRGDVAPISLRDLSLQQIRELHKALGWTYPVESPPEQTFDMLLIRSGAGSGHTVRHFHAHTATVVPDERVLLYNGANFREAFPTDEDAQDASSCLKGFSSPDLRKATRLTSTGSPYELYKVEVASTATGVEKHCIFFFLNSTFKNPAELSSNLFTTLMEEIRKEATTEYDFIYWERALNLLLVGRNMQLPIHVIRVKPGSVVKVEGYKF